MALKCLIRHLGVSWGRCGKLVWGGLDPNISESESDFAASYMECLCEFGVFDNYNFGTVLPRLTLHK